MPSHGYGADHFVIVSVTDSVTGNSPASVTTGLLDEAGMKALAASMAASVKPPLVVYLEGDLGSGKTTFTRALIHALGYPGRVKSPTYGLLETYPLQSCNIVHLDLYRIVQSGELEFLGIEDLLDEQSVFMIEWPDRGGPMLPAADLIIRFKHSSDARILDFVPQNHLAGALCTEIAKLFQ